MLLAPIIIPLLPRGTFSFQGHVLNYFFHAYNMTWASERCIEVPIGRFFVQEPKYSRILEVGNVLSHYGAISHVVVDKFEKQSGVINEDIVTYSPPQKFDLIISISTFEHIGFDDESQGSSGEKILRAIRACRGLLNSDGVLVITVPIGYNPELDRLIAEGCLGTKKETYLKRVAATHWQESAKDETIWCRYGHPRPYGNGILVAEFPALS
jgi:SAM-dependent methyltransferase